MTTLDFQPGSQSQNSENHLRLQEVLPMPRDFVDGIREIGRGVLDLAKSGASHVNRNTASAIIRFTFSNPGANNERRLPLDS